MSQFSTKRFLSNNPVQFKNNPKKNDIPIKTSNPKKMILSLKQDLPHEETHQGRGT